jgi:hypothetical protein
MNLASTGSGCNSQQYAIFLGEDGMFYRWGRPEQGVLLVEDPAQSVVGYPEPFEFPFIKTESGEWLERIKRTKWRPRGKKSKEGIQRRKGVGRKGGGENPRLIYFR